MSIEDKILPVIPTWCDLYEMEDKFIKRGERIAELEAQVTSLERSRKLCHHYAGCTADNCKLDGDNCSAALDDKS